MNESCVYLNERVSTALESKKVAFPKLYFMKLLDNMHSIFVFFSIKIFKQKTLVVFISYNNFIVKCLLFRRHNRRDGYSLFI